MFLLEDLKYATNGRVINCTPWDYTLPGAKSIPIDVRCNINVPRFVPKRQQQLRGEDCSEAVARNHSLPLSRMHGANADKTARTEFSKAATRNQHLSISRMHGNDSKNSVEQIFLWH